jgi:thiosulfate dehydrogenase (quinone) large subunit
MHHATSACAHAIFMLAGTASTNPVLGAISILIIFGWKVAGAWGVDRSLAGPCAPWAPGWLMVRPERGEATDEEAHSGDRARVRGANQ